MRVTYSHLEHLHHKYGLVLHGSVFLFSLLLGMSLGIFILLMNLVNAKKQTQAMRVYEHQVMTKLVKQIEAATPVK